MSPKSSNASKGRGPKEAFPLVTLENLPSEIKDQIFSYMPQDDLHNLLFTSPSLTEAIIINLYNKPKFVSTYRFAQFVTTVSHSKRYADMVKILEIPGPDNPWSDKSDWASWREWKYRDQPLYAARSPSLFGAKCNRWYRSHPIRCPFMRFENSNVLPIGAVVHVLTACQNIRQIKVEVEQFQDDYQLNSPTYPPTALSSLIFESNVPTSWTFESAETSIVKLDNIIEYVNRLQLLEKLTIRTRVGFSMTCIADLITHCAQLTELELSGVGCKNVHLEELLIGLMTRSDEHSWSLKATKSELMERLSRVDSYGQESSTIDNPKAD